MRRDDFLAGTGARPATAKVEVLVGARAFWDRARRDIAAARERVLVQAMTYEGDLAGEAVAMALRASPAAERRLLVDAYSLHVTNDRLLPYLPWRPAALRAEARATRRQLDRLVAGGVSVTVTNPVGRNPLHFPLRNHKKLIVADGVAYLGGVNFSDHNFAWHDAMVRFDDARVADFLASTFAADRDGRPRCAAARFGPLDLIALDGLSNEAALAPVLELLAAARHSIEMIGAYPTLPFTDSLTHAAANGVAVTIYTPRTNNKPLLRDFLFAEAARAHGVRLALLPEMTHAKAAIVDGETVLFGSVNFNFASWRSNGDLLAIGRDPALVAAFERALFAPARALARPAAPREVPAWRRTKARLLLELADAALARLSFDRLRRAADWPIRSG